MIDLLPRVLQEFVILSAKMYEFILNLHTLCNSWICLYAPGNSYLSLPFIEDLVIYRLSRLVQIILSTLIPQNGKSLLRMGEGGMLLLGVDHTY